MGLISRVSSRTYRKENHKKKLSSITTNATGKRRGTRYMFSKAFATRVCQVWPPTCTYTNVVISLILKVMVPSKRVCHTKLTTVRLVKFSMLPKHQLVLLLTREF